MSEIKKKFYEKLENSGPQKHNSYTINRADYDSTMHRIIQLHEDNAVKKEDRDYRIISRFEVLEVNIEGQNIRKLVKKGTQLRYICHEVIILDVYHFLSQNLSRICSM